MELNTFQAAANLKIRLESYPWCVSVHAGMHLGEGAVIVTTLVHVPAQHRHLIPEFHLGIRVVHRKIGSRSPKGA